MTSRFFNLETFQLLDMFKIFLVELFLVISMVGFDFDPIHMTQKNDYEVVVSKRPTKFPLNEKGPRYIMDSLHLSYMVNSYNHHFMFYN